MRDLNFLSPAFCCSALLFLLFLLLPQVPQSGHETGPGRRLLEEEGGEAGAGEDSGAGAESGGGSAGSHPYSFLPELRAAGYTGSGEAKPMGEDEL